jgi:hypothetical protein
MNYALMAVLLTMADPPQWAMPWIIEKFFAWLFGVN